MTTNPTHSTLTVLALAFVVTLSPAISGLGAGVFTPGTDEASSATEAIDPSVGPESTSTDLPDAQQANMDLADRLDATVEDPTATPTEQTLTATATAFEQRQALAHNGPLDPGLVEVLDAQLANVDLTRALTAIEDDPSLTNRDQALATAHTAVQDRRDRIDTDTPHLAQQQAHLDAAEDLLATADDETTSEVERSIRSAQQSTRHQADTLGIEPVDVSPPDHASPSQAARELVHRHDATPTLDQRQSLDHLDDLPPTLREALTDYLDAFLAFETATQDTYADADTDHLAQLHPRAADTDGPAGLGMAPMTPAQYDRLLGDLPMGDEDPWETDQAIPRLPVDPAKLEETPRQSLSDAHADANLDLAEVFGARQDVLGAALDLHQALVNTGPVTKTTAPVDIQPALAIDLGESDDTYTEDYALVVDAGGDDTYENNAGGSNLHDGDCDVNETGGAAALLDLDGDDDYTTQRSCGAAGGGYAGSGFLVDADGNDTYHQGRDAAHTPNTIEEQLRSRPGSFTPSNAAMTDRYILGYEEDPGLAIGDTYRNATVLDTAPGLDFVVVEAEDPVAFPGHAREDPNTRYVEPDARVQLLSTPNDPLYDQQYGPQQINAPDAWDTSKGDASRAVCVLDTGIDYTHEDINRTRLLAGHDFANDDPDPMDGHGHGTHVSGIATAQIDNETGIAGTANVGLMAAKVIQDNGGGFASDIAQGIHWCAENGGDVISMSISGPDNHAIRQAVETAWEAESLLVAAAGNSGCYLCVSYPAAYDEVMAVTCTTPNENATRCGFSSYGPEAEVAAPGEDILSTMRPCGPGENPKVYFCDDDGYANVSGTSMSAPHVSGAAALAWSQAEDLTNKHLRQLLRDNAQAPPQEGCSAEFGYGIVDANATLTAAIDGERPTYEPFEGCFEMIGSFGVNGGGSLAGTGMLVDVGGNETYTAGGQGANGGGHGLGTGLLVDGNRSDSYQARGHGVNGGGASGLGTLVDHDGNDTYDGGSRGVNGGANVMGHVDVLPRNAGGVGLLVDADGQDRYTGHIYGVNGGGVLGVGALVDDGEADDTYTAPAAGVNGAPIVEGSGLLVDTGGDDRYEAQLGEGANGGSFGNMASGSAVGFLVDQAGQDTYHAPIFGTNGGTYRDGFGFLYDGGDADDTFTAPGITHGISFGSNGGSVFGQGYLADAGGDDFFEGYNGAASGTDSSGFLFDGGGEDLHEGGNGHAPFGRAVGALVDVAGNDTHDGANGGASGHGLGFLVDGTGDDTYDSRTFEGGNSWLGNGGARGNAPLTIVPFQTDAQPAGLLFDADGDDRYLADNVGNGGGYKGGQGFLYDRAGDDTYQAENIASNGGAARAGTGFLRDDAGDDTYQANSQGANGGSWSPTTTTLVFDRVCLYPVAGCEFIGPHPVASTDKPGAGLLLDQAGTDTYADYDGSRGTDTSRVPKGAGGAQIDLPQVPSTDASTAPGPVWNLTKVTDSEDKVGVNTYDPLTDDPPPGQPGEVTIQWGAPTDPGTGPVTGYRLYEVGQDGTQTLVTAFDEDQRHHMERGLDYLEQREYRVTAVNDAGEGEPADATVRAPRCEDTGPDVGGYTCTEIPFDWADTSDGTSITTFEDASWDHYDSAIDTSDPIQLPFNFTWYGDDHSQVRVLDFGLTCIGNCTDRELMESPRYSSGEYGYEVGNNVGPEHEVNCAQTYDPRESMPDPADVRYSTVGEEPNRTFVVEWQQVPTHEGGSNTFQLHLTEDGKARCMIEEADPWMVYDIPTFTVGTQSSNATSGVTYRTTPTPVSEVGVQFAPRPHHLVAAPTANATNVTVGEPVEFVDASSSPEPITDIAWDFDDGTASTAGAPVHAFEQAGSYTVTLTVEDQAGTTDRAPLEVTVHAP
jgi:subtilisin family serine protease